MPMSRDAQKTLFHPFDSGALDAPAAGARILFIGAEPGFRLPEDFSVSLALVQGFRPYFLQLKAAGYDPRPRAEGENFDGALVLCGRHRGQNEAWLAEAMERVGPGGRIVAAGSSDDGIGSLRKRLDKIVGLDGHLPKYHGVAFWFRRPENAGAGIAALREGNEGHLAEGRFVTAPGMFSHGGIDPGSRLLAGKLPELAKGAAADFGAGWGFLSAALAERTQGLSAIDLYEADHDSLEAARKNLAALPAPPFGYFWHDLVAEPVERKYNLVVMNPPFHQGRAAEPSIGQAMLRAASAALRPGGRLLMVQNRGLPYDQALKAGFSEVSEIASDGGFRVISARR
jgi:16S rRNA (guanine1207-N2)-methyltransferase